jgi:hypothetical protein
VKPEDHGRTDPVATERPGRWRAIYLAVLGFNLLVYLSLWVFSRAF